MDDEMGKIRDLITEVRQLSGPQATGTAQITISAGGVGIWIAVTACAMTLAAMLVGTVFVAIGMADLNRQTQELRQSDQTIQAYINAGYVQPKEDKQ